VVNEKRFRAYDIEYLSSSQMLAVSHERFDRKLGKSRMAVSVIPIDDDGFRPTGPWKTIFLSDPEPNDPSDESDGRLAVGEHQKLYLTVGNYFADSTNVTQDLASSFGKIFEIDLDTDSTGLSASGTGTPRV
jgi:Glucose / Sorbosone dehydrogenase